MYQSIMDSYYTRKPECFIESKRHRAYFDYPVLCFTLAAHLYVLSYKDKSSSEWYCYEKLSETMAELCSHYKSKELLSELDLFEYDIFTIENGELYTDKKHRMYPVSFYKDYILQVIIPALVHEELGNVSFAGVVKAAWFFMASGHTTEEAEQIARRESRDLSVQMGVNALVPNHMNMWYADPIAMPVLATKPNAACSYYAAFNRLFGRFRFIHESDDEMWADELLVEHSRKKIECAMYMQGKNKENNVKE